MAYMTLTQWCLLIVMSIDISQASMVIPFEEKNNTLTLGLFVPWEQGFIIGPYLGSAVVLGIQAIENQQLLPDYQVEWIHIDDHCEPRHGMAMAVELYSKVQSLNGIIGSACSVVCQPVSLLAASWAIPVVSWQCASSSLSNKEIYPTFSRVETTWMMLPPIINALTDMFNWNKMAVISTFQDVFLLTANAIALELEDNGKQVILQVIDPTYIGDKNSEDGYNALQQIIAGLKHKVRVFVYLLYPTDMRNLMIIAYDEGMLNGEYAFVTHEYGVELGVKKSYRPELDHILYDGLIAVGVKLPSGPVYDAFLGDVIKEFQDERFDHLPHLPADATIDQVDLYACKFVSITLE